MYHTIESEINDMMVKHNATRLHVNRVIADYSVSLYANGTFSIGCALFQSTSGMAVAQWLYNNAT